MSKAERALSCGRRSGEKSLLSAVSYTHTQLQAVSYRLSNRESGFAATAEETEMAGKEVSEVETAMCDCCGLTEECTPGYIARVQERHAGKWICGLCSEAVKDEISRSGRRISTEEALERHASFSRSFRSPTPSENGSPENPIAAVLQILRRSLDSPRELRSNPSTPRRKDGGGGGRLARSESCFPTLAG